MRGWCLLEGKASLIFKYLKSYSRYYSDHISFKYSMNLPHVRKHQRWSHSRCKKSTTATAVLQNIRPLKTIFLYSFLPYILCQRYSHSYYSRFMKSQHHSWIKNQEWLQGYICEFLTSSDFKNVNRYLVNSKTASIFRRVHYKWQSFSSWKPQDVHSLFLKMLTTSAKVWRTDITFPNSDSEHNTRRSIKIIERLWYNLIETRSSSYSDISFTLWLKK